MPGKPAVILLVDDDVEILESIENLLAGYVPDARILTATSGADALGLIKKETPNVIVSDYRMGGMDGIEFLKRTLALAPKATRLMMSAYADSIIAKRAVSEAGVAFLITKPFQLEPFVQLVQSLVGKHAS